MATWRSFSLRFLISGLSGRLLLLTILFVLIAEVMIYVPSIARFRLSYLSERLEAAHLGTLALQAMPEGVHDQELENRILDQAGVYQVALRRADASMLMMKTGMPLTIDATYDLGAGGAMDSIFDAFETLAAPGGRMIRVLDTARTDPSLVIEVVLDEEPLCVAMVAYSERILVLSIVISLITASLLYLTLLWLIVRPMRYITDNLVGFRDNPEDAGNIIATTARRDEIGHAQHELATMQRQLRASLLQKTRLAALGAAMSRINHDLRNSLAQAMVVSDRLTESDDPEVRKVTPRLMAAIDRAVALCSQTLNYAHSDEAEPHYTRFSLHELVDDIGQIISMAEDKCVAEWFNQVPPELEIEADRDQLFRVLFNVGQNASKAIDGDGSITIRAKTDGPWVRICIRDTGHGLAARARENLFKPFAGSARAGGTGLGLAIARELMRFHGGDIELLESSPEGTEFRMNLPVRA